MKEEEYIKLVNEFGEKQTKIMIEYLDNYKGSKGKTYKNDYRAILSWCVKKYIEDNNKEKIKSQNNIPQKNNYNQRSFDEAIGEDFVYDNDCFKKNNVIKNE